MSLNDFLAIMQGVLNFTLLEMSGTEITVATVLTALATIAVTFWISRSVRSASEGLLRKRGARDGSIETAKTLVHYAILIVGFSVALQIAGIDLTTLFAAGAIFAIALGFALQGMVQNFVAGIVLLIERTIKPGDVLEVEDRVVRVEVMGIRSTVARSRDGEEVVIPNYILVGSTFKNYTLADAFYRMQVSVGVVYASDMKLVRNTLERVASEVAAKWGVTAHQPLVVMSGFGDNAVEFKVAIWMTNPWKWLPAINELHEAIWWAFQEAGIVIAFPQMDVHFDPGVSDGFRSLAAGGRGL